jgi:hypothetical protein
MNKFSPEEKEVRCMLLSEQVREKVFSSSNARVPKLAGQEPVRARKVTCSVQRETTENIIKRIT